MKEQCVTESKREVLRERDPYTTAAQANRLLFGQFIWERV